MSDPVFRSEDFPPFKSLRTADLAAVRRLEVPVALRKGKALYYQGDRADRCWLLLSGCVRTAMYRSDETMVELGKSSAGDWLGLSETILDAPYLCDAIAEESSVLTAFPRPAFERILAMSGMREHFLREMARRYYVLHSRVELNLPFDRLVRFLLDRCPGEGESEVRCTQEQIAEAIGAARETVNRQLARLEAQGLVTTGRGSITVAKPGELRRLCG